MRLIYKVSLAQIITVTPIKTTYEDGAKLVAENTKITNGHLAEPKCDRKENINDGWDEINAAKKVIELLTSS